MSGKRRIPASKSKSHLEEIHLVKDGHHYLFRYQDSNQLSVVCALLSCAMDPRLNLDLEDAREILKAMGISIAAQ